MLRDGACRFAVLARVPSDHDGIEGDGSDASSASHDMAPSATIPPLADADSARSSKADLSRLLRGDLLLALSASHMHVLARKIKNLGCSCRQDAHDKVLALGLHCPHMVDYDDYCFVTAVPFEAIAQVLITYRTASASHHAAATESATGASVRDTSDRDTVSTTATSSTSGVAARTKELILKLTAAGAHVWLGFEHNLARGAFLEALTAAVTASQARVDLDVDYIDVSDTAALPIATSVQALAAFSAQVPLVAEEDEEESWVLTPQSAALELYDSTLLSPTRNDASERDARFAFVRDALRHVVFDKVQLALQLAREHSSPDDPTCALLLATAAEIAQALDEPDLSAFAWLASAFVHVTLARSPGDELHLALAQVTHSVAIARTHGCAYLLSLALHCASDVHALRREYAVAKDLLVEAARAMPDGLEPGMKMQLHRKIHDLRDCASAECTASSTLGSSSVGDTKRATHSRFSLWDHSGSARFKELLLCKVFKLPAASTADSCSAVQQRSSSCFVEVVREQSSQQTGSATQRPSVRLRVFFDTQATVMWLKREVETRVHAVGGFGSSDISPETVGSVWKRCASQRQLLALTARLGEVVTSDTDVLVATLVQDGAVSSLGVSGASSTSEDNERTATTQSAPPAAVLVTCSVCHARIPLDDVESHSDECN